MSEWRMSDPEAAQPCAKERGIKSRRAAEGDEGRSEGEE